MKNEIDIYSKVEKDIDHSAQQKDLSKIEKNQYAREEIPQNSNSFEKGMEI